MGYPAISKNADCCKLTKHFFRPLGAEIAGYPAITSPIAAGLYYNSFPVFTASCKLLTLNLGLYMRLDKRFTHGDL